MPSEAQGAEVIEMRPAPKLILVEPDGTATEIEECPDCLESKVKAEEAVLEREGVEDAMRSLAAKYRHLKRDLEAQAKADALWPEAAEAFEYWRVRTGKTARAKFDPARFYLLRPYLRKDGLDMVKLAIDGAAYDPHVADRPAKNGHVEVYDGLETIFKNRGAFERHWRKAPRERIEEVRRDGPTPYTPLELRIKAEVILALEDDLDELGDLGERVADAIDRAKRELTGRGEA